MEKRNVISVIVIAFALVFFIWFVILGGSNPFVPKLNVKITGGIDCAAGFCWFSEVVNMEYSPSTLSVLKPLSWWCGPFGGAKDLEATLTVRNPDFSMQSYKKSQGTCEDRDLEFYFSVPMDKGSGNYNLEAKICGETWILGWRCVTRTERYYYGG